MSRLKQGLIHVYTGDGKGKTTAALGLALRAAGHGMRTCFCQFMKGQDYGELRGAAMLAGHLTMAQFGRPTFIHLSADGQHSTANAEDIRLAQEGLAAARHAMLSGEYDIVVLDEINVALFFALLTVQDVLSLLDDKPPQVELILTGRRVPPEILARADYVTEMREVEHPYRRGIQARSGIEF
jgi:cob(I)alamin adenosyltransferase